MKRLYEMNRDRQAMLARWVLADSLGILLLCYTAQALGSRSRAPSGAGLAAESVVLMAVTVFMLWFRGLYAIQAKYLNLKDVADLFKLGFVSSLLLGLLDLLRGIPRLDAFVVTALYFLAFAPALAAIRSLHRRIDGNGPRRPESAKEAEGLRTLILGGGDAGEMVIREIRRMRAPTHRLVGIVDDDLRKSYTHMHGVPVVGTTGEIEALVEKLDIDEILITVPSADGALMRRLAAICGRTRAHVRTLPGVQDLLSGDRVTNQIRDVEVSDLLRRKTVPEDAEGVAELLRGQVVLITGAGGSIGSELARQAARQSPAKLILLGKGENSIFEIEQEIVRDGFPTPEAVIADVRDSRAIDRLFARFRPTIVFHAAAHKHVPLMQGNPTEAVRNNVFGTINVVEAAVSHGASHLILVSTDKAVNPGNVMGATKRVAELAVRALTRGTNTCASIVRFGNVLGSRGSLVPMLKAQIARGGPVRITHPDMTRFFMTIPEAVGLIFQAGRLGGSGETFILDMGEPIRILDLAKDLIRLHGYEPDKTMPIVITGIRPGEKLEEELSYDFETLVQTAHPKIRSALHKEPIDEACLRRSVHDLRRLCDIGTDEEVREALMRIAGRTVDSAANVADSAPFLPKERFDLSFEDVDIDASIEAYAEVYAQEEAGSKYLRS